MRVVRMLAADIHSVHLSPYTLPINAHYECQPRGLVVQKGRDLSQRRLGEDIREGR
jgi:hypothetical protein